MDIMSDDQAKKTLRSHRVSAEISELKNTRDQFAIAAMRSIIPLWDQGRWSDERIAYVADLVLRMANTMMAVRAELDKTIDFTELAGVSVDERFPNAKTTEEAAGS